ncbi:MAG: redoxin domain-containing protein [Gammaproteobacteria bacterium]|nr:redoxin domain-containing protein [Gammaproteobacteria bacterium]
MKKLLIFAAGVAIVPVVLVVASALSEPVEYHGTHLSPAMPAADFTLRSADGPVSPSDFEGKAVPLFFGYTSCPDVCPTTLLRLSAALEAFEERGGDPDDVQVVFVSVDPERDSPERASEYARAVDPSFVGVTGTPEEIADVAAKYGIYYAKAEGSEATGYLVDHSATITVLNEDGEVALLWSPTVTAEQMAEDLDSLLGG